MANIVRTGGVSAVSIGSYQVSTAWHSYGGSGYGSVIDTGDTTNKKAVFVTGTASGTGSTGYGQGSNDNSTWTKVTTGTYTYRYYRAYAKCTDSSSSISYGYIGAVNLGVK